MPTTAGSAKLSTGRTLPDTPLVSEVCPRITDRHGEGLALCHLASLHRHAGELSEAGELLGRSLEIRRQPG